MGGYQIGAVFCQVDKQFKERERVDWSYLALHEFEVRRVGPKLNTPLVRGSDDDGFRCTGHLQQPS